MWGHEASSAMQKRMLGFWRSGGEPAWALDALDAMDAMEYAAAPPAVLKNDLRETRERFILGPPYCDCRESTMPSKILPWTTWTEWTTWTAWT